VSTLLLVLGLLAVFAGLAALLGMAALTVADHDPQQSRMRRRMSIYTLTGRQAKTGSTAPPTVLGTSNVARSAVELAGRVTARGDVEDVLATRLDAAGLPLKAPEWMLIHVGSTIGLALLLLLLSGGGLVATLIGAAIGGLVPWAFLRQREHKRRGAFLAALPDTLQMLAGTLSTGYSLPQAVDAVVREAPEPMSTELGRALVDARLGVPLEDALEAVAVRMASVDFGWVVMAIRVQREVGGNLAEVLTTVATTLRDRERLRRQVEVLSAEGRLSAWILGSLPVMFVLYLAIMRPDYLAVLYTTPLGWAMILLAVAFFTGGVFWLRRVVTVEV